MSIKHSKNSDKYLDIRKVLKIIFKNWYWFVISLFITFSIAYAFSKIITPKYLVTSRIYIKDNMSSNNNQAMAFLQSMDMFNTNMDYKNEMLIINSYPFIFSSIKKLNLNISYYHKGKILWEEIYHKSPFTVVIDSTHNQIVNTDFSVVFNPDGIFTINAEKDNYKTYNYTTNLSKKTTQNLALHDTSFHASLIEGKDYRFRIFVNKGVDLNKIAGKKYKFKLYDENQLTMFFKNKLKVMPVNPEVSVLELSLETESPAKGVDFIKTLMNYYLSRNLERKNHLAENTIKFINSQLDQIADSLSTAETNLANFRSNNQVIDISSNATNLLERLKTLELEKSRIEQAAKYYNYMEEYCKDMNGIDNLVVPSSSGVENIILNELITNLIKMKNDRDDLLARKQQKSPFFINLEMKLKNQIKTINENIRFSKESIVRQLEEINQQISSLNTKVAKLPKTERNLVGMKRKFTINDNIYTFLLEKRAEAQIAKAGNLPEHDIVEQARVIDKVFPNLLINFALAFILGIFIPGVVIFILEVNDDRIRNEQDLKDRYPDFPFYGTIIRKTSESNFVAFDEQSSAIAETFRTLRTNLSFSMNNDKKCQTILVTSSVANEGKSFISINLAHAISALNKKAILLGFDLRKHKQFRDFARKTKIGITSYCVGDKKPEDIIQHSQFENLDFILPGIIPPNPLELIGSEATSKLFEYLKNKYDYIIIDTPPVGVISDSLLLMQYSDLNIFVVREQYSKRSILNTVLKELKEKNKNVGFVLNNSAMEGKKYRYDYYNKYNAMTKKYSHKKY